jgi:5-hydroxyisourate hydrolase
MSHLSCHILDTANGIPAQAIEVYLLKLKHNNPIATSITNTDGRVSFGDIELSAGQYTLRFLVSPYCIEHFGHAFYPMIDVHFDVDGQRNYHIPLLLSPYSYSSYRGS